ncbi:hypothetical protein U3653_32165 [Nocardia sp. CDC186]|uniref:Uncharacterized protein n=1 Tax=Nocardia implantans TaxID=3108168 RepID=A0ABU6B540_9NOCA|nr:MULTISPECIES: hypothetical protein [unclassified Nocardia]MEA3532830.1 hypothetical protein [Nocardia sp. CDC192]MEB3514702.1 hypothetical protein [Nocardia sp. CDC186]
MAAHGLLGACLLMGGYCIDDRWIFLERDLRPSRPEGESKLIPHHLSAEATDQSYDLMPSRDLGQYAVQFTTRTRAARFAIPSAINSSMAARALRGDPTCGGHTRPVGLVGEIAASINAGQLIWAFFRDPRLPDHFGS